VCFLIDVLIKCIDCCDLIFTVGIAVIYVHRVKLYCIDYSLHRLPMRASKLLSPGQLPTDLSAGARGKGGRYKKRELRTHWVPGGDQETGQPNERTDGRTEGR